MCLRVMQEEYRAKGNTFYMCFVDLEKAFDRVQMKVLGWSMRKKGIPKVLDGSVMILYEEERNTRSFGWISDDSV